MDSEGLGGLGLARAWGPNELATRLGDCIAKLREATRGLAGSAASPPARTRVLATALTTSLGFGSATTRTIGNAGFATAKPQERPRRSVLAKVYARMIETRLE
eukprot:11304704-Alexandrium_andersonii.AAC.1